MAFVKKKLTKQQERFCEEYIIDLNATQAAIRAEYSPKTARMIASRLLTNVYISERISELKSKQSQRLQIEADRVLLEMARVAFFDPRKLYDENGQLKEVHELDDDTAAAIQGVDVKVTRSRDGKEEFETTALKIANKNTSLEMLGRHFEMFKDKIELEVLPIKIYHDPEPKPK